MKELTSENGQTKYNQKQNSTTKSDSETTGSSSDTKSSESIRDLTATSTSNRASIEKANIGFQISFSVLLHGRFPTTPGASCS